MLYIGMATVIAVILAMFLKQVRPEYGVILCVAVSIFIFGESLDKVSMVLTLFENMNQYVKLDDVYMKTFIKIIGIAYIAEFSSDLCKDNGYQALGNQIQIFGKLSILTVSVPIVMALLESIDLLLL